MPDTPSRRRRRGAPADLGALLAEVAQRSGPMRLRQASVAAGVAEAVGPFLARRLSGIWLEGEGCLLESLDREAVAEINRHAPLVLERLRRRLGALAPATLVVRHAGVAARSRAEGARSQRVRAAPPESAAEPRPLAERALESIVDPADHARLARWIRRGAGTDRRA